MSRRAGAVAILGIAASVPPAFGQSHAYGYEQALYLCGYLDAIYRVPSWHHRCRVDAQVNTIGMNIDLRSTSEKFCGDVVRAMRSMNVGMANWKLEVRSPTFLNKPGVTCRLHNPS